MKSYHPAYLVSICIFLLPLFSQSQAQNNLQDEYQILIEKTDEKITIDGDLSEQVWSEAQAVTDFWMSFPVDDRRAAQEIQTEVRVAHDGQTIYIAATCYGPDDYVIQTLKRDDPLFWTGDAFGVVIDPVNERTNGFSFSVNPANVQLESLIAGFTGIRGDNRPGQAPTGINSAWDNKWFSGVKTFPDRWTLEIAIPLKSLRYKINRSVWGINFIRGESSSNSYHTWSPVPVQFRAVDLGYTGAMVWDVAPKKANKNISVIPYVLGSTAKDFEEASPVSQNFRAGADAKIALGPGLNLDMTINPDFSQVDVDQQVTNLTRFNIRFPERRLFFLENSDLFESFGIPPMRPFFSRRIGLDEDGQPIPIAYGARLSGNINKDLRIGVMNLQTRATDDFQAQNYTSVAVHQRFLKRSVVKGYFHNRQSMVDGDFNPNDYNRTAGLEVLLRSADGRWQAFSGGGLSMNTLGDNENFFYNIGASYEGRNLSVYSNLAGAGVNYLEDMGFITLIQQNDAERDITVRTGYHHWFTRASYTIYPESSPKVNFHRFSGRQIYDATTNDWTRFIYRLQLGYTLSWQNTSVLSFEYSHDDINLLYPDQFTDGIPLPAGLYKFNAANVRYQSDTRKRFSFNAGFQYGTFFNGTREQYVLGVKYRAQPWGNFSLNFEQNNLDFPEPYSDGRLFLIGPRIEINFSRALFWTTFLQYNTQRDNFNINSRLQWRFQPMSDLFLVYSDNYAVDIWGPKNRALVLKLNYWFNL